MRRAALVDGRNRSSGIWRKGGRVVSGWCANGWRLLPHAAGAYRHGGASGSASLVRLLLGHRVMPGLAEDSIEIAGAIGYLNF